MRISTINIRYENEHDGINSWENRSVLLSKFINEHQFDFIGTQEGRKKQIYDLSGKINLKLVDSHRGWIEERMYPSIYFNKEKYDLHSSGDIWLSETPTVPGSSSFRSAFPRLASWAKLELKSNHFKLLIVNVHLDHVLEETRINQIRILTEELDKIIKQDEKLIILGDFNDSPNSLTYQTLLKHFKLTDPWINLNVQEESSHHGFNGQNNHGHRIDWILHDHHFTCERIYLDKTHQEKIYLSDHFPVVATLIPSWI